MELLPFVKLFYNIITCISGLPTYSFAMSSLVYYGRCSDVNIVCTNVSHHVHESKTIARCGMNHKTCRHDVHKAKATGKTDVHMDLRLETDPVS